MTTFESIMCLAATAAVIILAFGTLVIVKKVNHIAEQHKSTWAHFDNVVSQLYAIRVEVGQTNGRIDGFIPAFKKLLEHNESIENFWASDSSLVIKLLKELVDIEHKSDERNDNMFPFMQEVMRNYNPPCYSPDGICTNPQMDCINCPKRSAGGTWSTNTSIKAEDAPLKEWFIWGSIADFAYQRIRKEANNERNIYATEQGAPLVVSPMGLRVPQPSGCIRTMFKMHRP